MLLCGGSREEKFADVGKKERKKRNKTLPCSHSFSFLSLSFPGIDRMDAKGNPLPSYGSPPPSYGSAPPPEQYPGASQYPGVQGYTADGLPIAQAYVDNGEAQPQYVAVTQTSPPQPATFFGDTPAYIVDGESGFSGYTEVQGSCGAAACIGCLATFGLSLCFFPELLKDKTHINPTNNRKVRCVYSCLCVHERNEDVNVGWMNRKHSLLTLFFPGLVMNVQVATYKKDPCIVFDPPSIVAESY